MIEIRKYTIKIRKKINKGQIMLLHSLCLKRYEINGTPNILLNANSNKLSIPTKKRKRYKSLQNNGSASYWRKEKQ